MSATTMLTTKQREARDYISTIIMNQGNLVKVKDHNLMVVQVGNKVLLYKDNEQVNESSDLMTDVISMVEEAILTII